jgi:hypothetical protein
MLRKATLALLKVGRVSICYMRKFHVTCDTPHVGREIAEIILRREALSVSPGRKRSSFVSVVNEGLLYERVGAFLSLIANLS